VTRLEGSSWEGGEFKSVNNEESGICGVGFCDAESDLHGNATVFRRFLSGVLRSAESNFCMHS
jgi:hypothetical protein